MLIYLAFRVSWGYNVAKANKGRTRGTAIPHAPMQVNTPPTQQYYCAYPHYSGSLYHFQGCFGGLCLYAV